MQPWQSRPILEVVLILALACVGGCGQTTYGSRQHGDVIFLVPGAAGPGPAFHALAHTLSHQAEDRQALIVRWGAPPLLFVLNFQSQGIHDTAEKDLAHRIMSWRGAHPHARIGIVAHSAGAGVTLGAMARLNCVDMLDTVILLAPSVSPTYDLNPSLATARSMHVFHSDRDVLFLRWRTSTFGTYDNVRSVAAGHGGFDLAALNPWLRSRIVQHAYDPEWRSLGNDGTHSGPLSRHFAATVLTPILATSPTPPDSAGAGSTDRATDRYPKPEN